jgi:ElaB/YqjD/DUF883 family membrane-anchored ribosome-binding protein
LGNLADQVATLLSAKGENVFDDALNRVLRIRDDLQAAGGRGQALMRDAGGSMKDFGETIEESVRERPLTMLAVAIGFGILIGTTLRR